MICENERKKRQENGKKRALALFSEIKFFMEKGKIYTHFKILPCSHRRGGWSTPYRLRLYNFYKEKYKNRPELSWNLDFDTIEGEALTSCLQNQLKAIFIEI